MQCNYSCVNRTTIHMCWTWFANTPKRSTEPHWILDFISIYILLFLGIHIVASGSWWSEWTSSEQLFTYSYKPIFIQSLSSTAAFSYACQFMTYYENQGEGIQWDNAKEGWGGFDFRWGAWMMLFDGIAYGLIGWYVRNVFPGEFVFYICIVTSMQIKRNSFQ